MCTYILPLPQVGRETIFKMPKYSKFRYKNEENITTNKDTVVTTFYTTM